MGSQSGYEIEQIICEELDSFQDSLGRRHDDDDLPPDVRDAIRYIHEHIFEEDLDATRVCEDCGLGNHNFSSYFKHTVGVGMRRYIEKLRITMAIHLLRHESISILEIAWSIGYSYPETFARAFRRNVGCSASHYRETLASKNGRSASGSNHRVGMERGMDAPKGHPKKD